MGHWRNYNGLSLRFDSSGNRWSTPVRGDSAYGREDIMSWCEAQAKVEYVLGYSSNERLGKLTWGIEQRAKAAYEQRRQNIASRLEALVASRAELKAELDALVPPQIWYQSFTYRTLDSWSCERRMVCKLTYDGTGARRPPCRHLLLQSATESREAPRGLLLSQRVEAKIASKSINSIFSVTAPPPMTLRATNCGCGFLPLPMF